MRNREPLLSMAAALMVLLAAPCGANDSLLGWWKFEEGTGATVADASPNGHDGSVIGAAWGPGRCSEALRLDGDSDYVYVGTNLLGGETFERLTVEARVRTDGIPDDYDPGWIAAYAVADETTDGQFMLGVHRDGYAYALLYTTVPDSITLHGNTTLVADGSWHSLCVVLGDTQVSLYVDGNLEVSADASGPLVADNSWHVTVGAKYTDDPAHFFPGDIDEVKIYDWDVASWDSLVAWWSFYEGMGTLVHDFSGNCHDGTIYDDPDPNDPSDPTWVDGIEYSLDFDAEDDYVYLGTELLGGEQFDRFVLDTSITTPGIPDDYNPGWEAAYAFADETTDGEFMLGVDREDRAYAAVYADPAVTLQGVTNVADELCHHLRLVKTANQALLYVDGQLEANAVTVGPLSVNGLWHVTIGGKYTDDPAHFFPGTIEETVILDCDSTGDINADLCVDLADLAVLLANYGLSADVSYAEGDLNGDGLVDLADLAGLLANYGACCHRD